MLTVNFHLRTLPKKIVIFFLMKNYNIIEYSSLADFGAVNMLIKKM